MLHRLKIALLCIAIVVLAFTSISTQAQGAVRVTLREIDLSNYPYFTLGVPVVSSYSVPVLDLTNSSFELFEDGRPLPIENVDTQINYDASIAVMLVLDLSNSSQIDDVKSATNRFLDTLGPNVRVAVIGFNEPLDFSGLDPVKEIGFTTDLDAVHAMVDFLPRGGASAIYEAIYKGVLLTSEEIADYRAVIVMTDGYDTASRSRIASSDTPLRAARERRIPIFTIGAYMPGMGSDPDYLNLIARETGASYRDITDLTELNLLFESIIVQLQTEYLLTFRTPLSPDGREHVLTVRALTTEGVGEGTRTLTYPSPPPVPQVLGLQREVDNRLENIDAAAVLRGRVLLVPQITAQHPLARVEYHVDGSLVHAAFVQETGRPSYAPGEWRWDTRSLDSGMHTLEIRVYDEAGNVSDPFIVEVQIEGGGRINPLLILAIVTTVILLFVVFFFILRHSKSRVVEIPVENDTLVGLSEWEPPSASPVTTVPFSDKAPDHSMAEPTYSSVPQPTYSMESPAPGASKSLAETLSIKRSSETMAWLICQKGVAVGREFRLHEVTSIGRLGTNDIVLDDPAVSRSHAKIRLDGQAFVITDLGAANPTLVNGQEIARYELQDDDRVEIGSNILVFKQIKSQQ